MSGLRTSSLSYFPIGGKKKPTKNQKTRVIQPKYLGLSDLPVPWSAELAFCSYSTCDYPLYEVTTSLLLFRTSVSLSLANAALSGVTLLFAVSTVWDPAALWWVMVDSETRHLLEQSTCLCLCVWFQKKPGYMRMAQTQLLSHLTARTWLRYTSMYENCHIRFSTAISSMSVVVPEFCLWKWIVPMRKLLFCHPLFYPASSPESFPERLSMSFPPWFKSRESQIKMLVPRGACRITGFVKSTREIHVFSSSAEGQMCHLRGKAPSWQWWEHHREWLHSCWAALELSSSNQASMFCDTRHNLWIMNRARSLMISRCDLTWIKPSTYCI